MATGFSHAPGEFTGLPGRTGSCQACSRASVPKPLGARTLSKGGPLPFDVGSTCPCASGPTRTRRGSYRCSLMTRSGGTLTTPCVGISIFMENNLISPKGGVRTVTVVGVYRSLQRLVARRLSTRSQEQGQTGLLRNGTRAESPSLPGAPGAPLSGAQPSGRSRRHWGWGRPEPEDTGEGRRAACSGGGGVCVAGARTPSAPRPRTEWDPQPRAAAEPGGLCSKDNEVREKVS